MEVIHDAFGFKYLLPRRGCVIAFRRGGSADEIGFSGGELIPENEPCGGFFEMTDAELASYLARRDAALSASFHKRRGGA